MAITLQGTNTASATTVTIPTHQAGDLILIWAVRGASATAPSLPSGYTPIATASVSTSVAVSGRLGYKIATSTSDTSGTWTNASEICCHVYRPSSGHTAGIGQVTTATATSTTISFPGFTLADSTSSNSWVVGMVGASNTTQAIGTAPTGMTNETHVTGASYQAAGNDTNGGVTSWTTQTVTVTTGHAIVVMAEIMLLPMGSGSTLSNVYQHVAGGGNPTTRGNSGNSFKLPLLNSSGAGNCLVLGITNDGAATVSSISDNINGTWGAAAVTALPGSGNLDSRVYVLPNIASGQVTITVTYSAAVTMFSYVVTELYGIATSSPSAGTTSASNSTTQAAGSFIPTNNNGTGGNLIWMYAAKAIQIPNGQTTHILPGANFALLSGDIGWNNANDSAPKLVEGYLQTTSASINPGFTSTSDSADPWNSLAVALKISSGAGTAPSTGIQIRSIHHFATEHFAASGTYVLECPSMGNLRCIMSDDPSLNTLTVTDSEGGTWSAGATGTGIWYRAATSPNPNLMIYLTGGGSDITLSWRFADISGAATSPYDSSVANGQTVNSVTSYTVSPAPSPSNTNGLVIANIGLGQGPGKAVTAPAGAVWDLCTYTGETDLDLIENADIMAHYHNTASGSQTWTFTITSVASNSTSGGLICFIAAPPPTAYPFGRPSYAIRAR